MKNKVSKLPSVILKDIREAFTKDQQNEIIQSARKSGYRLWELAEAFQVTNETIRQRLQKPYDNLRLRDYPPRPEAAWVAEEADRKQRNRRILGLKRDSPVMSIPVYELEKFRELYDGLNKDTRQDFGEFVKYLYDKYEIPAAHLEKVMGLSQSTIRAWRRRNGF